VSAPVVHCPKGIATSQFWSGHPPLPGTADPEIRAYRSGDLNVNPGEGAVADLRGERVRVYPDDMLRFAVHDLFTETIEWPAWGLPEDYLPLVPTGRTAFVKDGDRSVCHGGIAIEEVVVPFVEIEQVGV